MSSDLDADRIDYLMRSSQATGLPYGFHDRDFILRNLEIVDNPSQGDGDPVKFVCIKEKAVLAADHFLLSRMFDYLQVIFQKVVVGFELMLKVAVQALLRTGDISLEASDIARNITDGTWHSMHDAWLWSKFRECLADPQCSLTDVERMCIQRLLNRKSPPLLYSYDSVQREGSQEILSLHKSGFQNGVQRDEYLANAALTWQPRPFNLMNAKTHSFTGEPSKNSEIEKVIRISTKNGPVPIFKVPHSIVGALGDSAYHMARVYYVGPDDGFDLAKTSMKKIVLDYELPGNVTEKIEP